MGKRQYNSATDRKLQQRWQRVLERRESGLEVTNLRAERRKQKRTLYNLKNINIDRFLNEKIAIVCTTEKQARNVILKAQSKDPGRCGFCIETIPEELSVYDGVIALGIVTTDYWFGSSENIRCRSVSWFECNGFEIVDYYELLPVIDLGEVQDSPETVDFLLGI